MGITHAKVSTVPEGSDPDKVRTSDWNADHVIPAGLITDTEIATANKDGASGTPSMRTIGTGAAQAAAGNHNHAGTYSTPADVAAAIAALVASSPAALDTLNELAVALGNDPNFATTIATALGLKASIASLAAVAFSGSASDLGTGSLPAARIAAALITSAMLRDSAGVSVIGRAANSSGVPADIAAGADGDILRRAGGVVGFGSVPVASVTGLATVATSASAADLSAGTLAAARMPALTGDVTTVAGAVATTIGARKVTAAMMPAATATSKIWGRKSASGGDFEEVTASEVLDFLSTTNGALLTRTGGTWAPAANVSIVNGDLTIAAVTPGTPAAGLIEVAARSVGGLLVPTWTSPEAITYSICDGQGSVNEWIITPATTVISAKGQASPTNTGTVTARTQATTNYFTHVKRVGVVATVGAGQSCGWRGTLQTYGLGNAAGAGGFHYVKRFGVSDGATVANARMFVGLIALTTAITNAEPSVNINMLGVGCEAGQTNLRSYANDGSGTATMVDLGANFPSQTLSVDWYELAMFAKPQATEVKFTLWRMNTGHIASGTWSSDLPLATQLLCPVVWRNSGSTSTPGVAIDVGSFWCRTDS